MLEKFFKLKENGTNVKTEIIAGITSFMTMAYILAVNPSIMSAAGMELSSLQPHWLHLLVHSQWRCLPTIRLPWHRVWD